MRVVIDTNIWVSGLLWRGLPWKLLRLAEAGEIELCMAPPMLVELTNVLSYGRLQPRLKQLGLTPAELVAYAVNLASFYEVPEGDPIVVADPDDDVFLHCAAISGTDYVVSGDRHLLDLGSYMNIPILSVREFLSQLFPEHVG
ncbi:MAG: putative toxin-antitoxin system toxin component, PIN family [Chloroflexi bacterium]|nr:putative toxin-antitoxin system toxin component, PIN family [Chloroflexota bacterium]